MEASNYLDFFKEAKNKKVRGRYLPYKLVEEYLVSLSQNFHLQVEGKSVLGHPIYSVTFGSGSKKILMWSQMHGNESTTTKAVLDVLNSFSTLKTDFFKELSKELTIKIIPVLSPDGLLAYTRVNANEVDLNRDAQDLSQPESNVLKKVFEGFQPDFCFNLHDQRTIFSAGEKNKPATVSFLAPAYNAERSVNHTRTKAMQLIAEMNDVLQKLIPEQIGRYDDGFNLNCVGDTFQAANVPTILFEAGHYQNDYVREETRKYIYIAICKALASIVSGEFQKKTIEDYFGIPENGKLYYDIIVRGAEVNGESLDIAIQYEERLIKDKIEFIPKIAAIGGLENHYGHQEFLVNNKNIKINDTNFLEIGAEIQELKLDRDVFLINLTIS